MADNNYYTLIIQNKASKEYFRYDKLINWANSHLYYRFDVELGVPDGEYAYCLFINNRSDVEIEYKNPLQECILRIPGYEDILLRDLQPSNGLIRVGKEIKQENIYETGNDKNNVFYYDE